ncbi:MAG: UvrD-helicase domain-containing protein, partial [Candidatus Promineifilaceae bacterium]
DSLVPYLVELLRLWQIIQEQRAASNWAGVAALLKPLRDNMKTHVGRQGSWQPADPKAVIIEIRDSFDASLSSFIKGTFNLILDQQWAQLHPALSLLFNRVNARYRALKGYGQKLDFDDLESGALDVLQQHQEVRERWQHEIDAVLVDEFQDTNGRQRDLVNLLTGRPGKLFIVGDAKQSIYRFRGAEVEVFRAERARIDQGQGIAFELSTSYRAHRDLLIGLNDLLEPVLGTEEDADRPWREPFGGLKHYREEPKPGISAPYIELHLAAGSKGGGALNRAAEGLVSHIVELVDEEGSEVRYGDIAILCRASTSFSAYETALDQANVPYLTVSGRGFYDRPEIRDLLNILFVIADPVDDLALTGMLRSPAIGLTDMELYELFMSWNEDGREGSLWQHIQETSDSRVNHAVTIIGELHALSGRIPVAGILEELINRTDYKSALLGSSNSRAARNVSKLLVDAHNSGIVGVGDFLSYIQGLRSGQSREGEAPAITGDAVRIMTVHAAKGLEFPVVVIGDINHSQNRSAKLIIDPALGVFPRLSDDEDAKSYMFELLLKKEQDQEDAESDRLLYVAATRAKDKLILSGTFKLKKDGAPGYLGGWFKKLDKPLGISEHEIRYNEEGSRARRSILKTGQSEVGVVVYEPGISPAWIAPPLKREALSFDDWTPKLLVDCTEHIRIPELPDDEPAQTWKVLGDEEYPRAPGLVVGTLVHEALALWRFPGNGFRPWIYARARSSNLVGDAQVDDAVSRVEKLLERFREHGLYKDMAAADRRLAEVPFDRPTDTGHSVHGIIDALFYKDGEWTIVEYKTDKLANEAELTRVLYAEEHAYMNQVQGYISAVRQLVGQRPKAVLCFLDYQGGIRLKTLGESIYP